MTPKELRKFITEWVTGIPMEVTEKLEEAADEIERLQNEIFLYGIRPTDWSETIRKGNLRVVIRGDRDLINDLRKAAEVLKDE